jgi:hypothetical protein
MAAEVLDYRATPKAAKAWKAMDTDEMVIARHNGLPVTVNGVIYRRDSAPYIAPPSDSA